jgi:hypothetical protein
LIGPSRLAAAPPAVGARHVGLGPGFVDEHQALDGQARLEALPPLPAARDIRTILFAGVQRFF